VDLTRVKSKWQAKREGRFLPQAGSNRRAQSNTIGHGTACYSINDHFYNRAGKNYRFLAVDGKKTWPVPN
jgi:hypothetical protein